MGAVYSQVFVPACEEEELQQRFIQEVSCIDVWKHKNKVTVVALNFVDKEKAQDYLSETTDRWENFSRAVRVGDFNKVIPQTKSYMKLNEELLNVRNEINDIKGLISQRVESTQKVKGFLTCNCCGSKLSSVYLYLNHNSSTCPICHNGQFLFTATEIKKMKKLCEKEFVLAKQKNQKLKENQDKVGESIGWLVGACFRD